MKRFLTTKCRSSISDVGLGREEQHSKNLGNATHPESADPHTFWVITDVEFAFELVPGDDKHGRGAGFPPHSWGMGRAMPQKGGGGEGWMCSPPGLLNVCPGEDWRGVVKEGWALMGGVI